MSAAEIAFIFSRRDNI